MNNSSLPVTPWEQEHGPIPGNIRRKVAMGPNYQARLENAHAKALGLPAPHTLQAWH